MIPQCIIPYTAVYSITPAVYYLDGVPALHGPYLAEVVGGQVRPEKLDDGFDAVRVLLLVDVTCGGGGEGRSMLPAGGGEIVDAQVRHL